MSGVHKEKKPDKISAVAAKLEILRNKILLRFQTIDPVIGIPATNEDMQVLQEQQGILRKIQHNKDESQNIRLTMLENIIYGLAEIEIKWRKRLLDLSKSEFSQAPSFSKEIEDYKHKGLNIVFEARVNFINKIVDHMYSAFQELIGISRMDSTFSTMFTKAQQARQYPQQSNAPVLAIVSSTLTSMPENPEMLQSAFTTLDPKVIYDTVNEYAKSNSPSQQAYSNDTYDFTELLNTLKSMKDQLGGAPVYGSKDPSLSHTNKTFFGVPVDAAKDWIKMTIKKQWIPTKFWKQVGKLFGVDARKMNSLYEECYLRILRFEKLLQHKDYFFNILDNKDTSKYNELCTITGLAWHPADNAAGVEKANILFIEKYLTDFFHAAREHGNDKLLEYFSVLSEGVCLEDRSRVLQEYAVKNPLPGMIKASEIPADWDTSTAIETVFEKEAGVVAAKIQDMPTPRQVYDHLEERGIFDMEFKDHSALDDSRVKPTLEQFKAWASEQVEIMVLEEPKEEEKPLPDKRSVKKRLSPS